MFVGGWSIAGLAVTGEGGLVLQGAPPSVVLDKTVLQLGLTGEGGGDVWG